MTRCVRAFDTPPAKCYILSTAVAASLDASTSVDEHQWKRIGAQERDEQESMGIGKDQIGWTIMGTDLLESSQACIWHSLHRHVHLHTRQDCACLDKRLRRTWSSVQLNDSRGKSKKSLRMVFSWKKKRAPGHL